MVEIIDEKLLKHLLDDNGNQVYLFGALSVMIDSDVLDLAKGVTILPYKDMYTITYFDKDGNILRKNPIAKQYVGMILSDRGYELEVMQLVDGCERVEIKKEV